jgi:Lhr-like helicase
MNPDSLHWAHPIVQEWFAARFGRATEPQEQGWPHILAGETTLISAPTGSGKTLAAFLACIDQLVRKAIAGELTDTTQILYVSPLKALGNDIQKNLEQPLGEILHLAGARGFLMPMIRTADEGSAGYAEAPAAHPGDHARVSLHPAHRATESRDFANGGNRHCGRNPRRGG